MEQNKIKKPLVINLTGSPGAGKSTGAAKIFSELKQRGINCELVTEFAKDKTWENNQTALQCAEYVFGNQSYRLQRCRDQVDVIVTDSPLLLSLVYNKNKAINESLPKLILDVFNTFNNINFFIERVKPYNPRGRNETAEESDKLSLKIKTLYDDLEIPYECIPGEPEGYEKIANKVLAVLHSEDY